MKKYTKYLFCYFTGNEPEEERICFAVSSDGYNFKPLNNGKPIIKQTKGTLCMRDPFLLRAEEGGFYIVATDMKSSLGWNSNHGIISWKSDDLINWYDETAVDFHKYNATKTADKIWAPEAIYDKDKKQYMVYYSAYNLDDDIPLCIWHSYTSDFKEYTEPKILFKPSTKLCCLDADIVEVNGKYLMCYADEYYNTICQAVADKPNGEYFDYKNNQISCCDRRVEGNCMYKLIGQNKYIMIMDMFCDGRYFMQETDDLMTFKEVEQERFNLDFKPRHGSMIYITDEEYNRLVERFGF